MSKVATMVVRPSLVDVLQVSAAPAAGCKRGKVCSSLALAWEHLSLLTTSGLLPLSIMCSCNSLANCYISVSTRADGGDQLASEFAAHINQLALKAPLQHRRPSPLEPPTAAVAAQMDALQINDWPEPDAGVNTAVSVASLLQASCVGFQRLVHSLHTFFVHRVCRGAQRSVCTAWRACLCQHIIGDVQPHCAALVES